MPSYFVYMSQMVPNDQVAADDLGLAGVYEVQVHGEDSDPHAVTAVLDAFHDHIGIRVLDDFQIGVKDASGEWVEESDNEDDPDPEDMPRAVFMGKAEDHPGNAACQFMRRNARMGP